MRRCAVCLLAIRRSRILTRTQEAFRRRKTTITDLQASAFLLRNFLRKDIPESGGADLKRTGCLSQEVISVK